MMVLHVFLLLVLIAILLLLLANIYYILVVRYNDQEEEIRRGRKARDKYEIVAFGSSYCRYAFDFSEVGKIGFNFGIVAQFLYYTDLMIRSFRMSYKRNALVVIVLPNLVFGEPGKGFYGASRYVRFVDKNLLKDEFSYKKLILGIYLPLFVPSLGNLKNCMKRILSYSPYNEYKRLEHNELSKEEIDMQARQRCNDWCKEFHLENTMSACVPDALQLKFDESVKILESIIEYCLSEGLRPALVVTPVSDVMHRYISKSFLDQVLYKNIKRANKRNIPLLDYFDDNRFLDADLYANNADFLNARGRKLFSKVVVEDLKQYYG
jgi:hypothetical protein